MGSTRVAKGVSESLRSPVGRGMLDVFCESVWQQMGFARSLGIYDGMLVTSLGQQGSMLEAVYTIPDSICINGGTSDKGGSGEEPYLPCGVTTALFDEVSTLAMVIADRTYRPGVSVSLSCHMFHPVAPGERVTFKSRGLKFGARLGYGEASMYREDGKLAARGRHVKHLPMGRAWDLTATPLLFPLARKYMGRQHEQWLRDPERTKGVPSGEHLLDLFKLENFETFGVEGDAAYFGAAPVAADAGGSMAEGQPGEDEGGFRSAEAECAVTKRMCNYIPGTMHGGAIAVAAEEIARRCPPAPAPMGTVPARGNDRVEYMEVHYMSPIKRRAGLAAVSTASGTGRNVTTVGLSEASGTQGGNLSAEAVLLWGQGRNGGEGKVVI
ncbi:unnamed protein product [Scytosiphon promiscuus]